MEICCFRDHCHSWMCLWTLPGRSGSCWTQLRNTCTGVWCWRTIATWCPWVSTTSLKGVCVISRLPLLGCWKLGHFHKMLGDLRLIFRGQIFLFSLWHQNLLVEWCSFCQSAKGQLDHAASKPSLPHSAESHGPRQFWARLSVIFYSQGINTPNRISFSSWNKKSCGWCKFQVRAIWVSRQNI